MSFIFDYLSNEYAQATKGQQKKELENWLNYLDKAEAVRQRDRILAWRDQVSVDNYAVNAGVGEYYHRTAGFVWRFEDPTGRDKARNHLYLYNLAQFGHKVYSRRDKAELAAAKNKVDDSLGPLSPL